MSKLFKRLANEEAGASAIEYGLIAVGICIAIVLIIPQVGISLDAAFATIDNGFAR